MDILDNSIEYDHELMSDFTRAGLNDAMRYSRGEIDIEPQEIAMMDACDATRCLIQIMEITQPFLQMLTDNQTPDAQNFKPETLGTA